MQCAEVVVLAGVEQVEAVVHQAAGEIETEAVRAGAGGRGAVRDAEAHGPRLSGHDVHVLPARRGLVDGLEADAVAAAFRAGHD